MKSDVLRSVMVLLAVFVWGAVSAGVQPARAFLLSAPSPFRSEAQQPEPAPERQRMPLFGKITAVRDGSLQVADTNGDTITVKINGQTEFRKDRQPAKRTDFKVGDIIIVRGEENADHSWTAEVVAARSVNGPNGPNGRSGPGGRFAETGTLGKDYLAGEIKSIDAPKLSVLRTDNVTQTMELNEDTSLRKGRDSITMADIQVGDHLFARGSLENRVFVPKTVVVIGPEQWKRLQDMGIEARGEGGRPRRQPGTASPPAPATPAEPGSPAPPPQSPEPQR